MIGKPKIEESNPCGYTLPSALAFPWDRHPKYFKMKFPFEVFPHPFLTLRKLYWLCPISGRFRPVSHQHSHQFGATFGALANPNLVLSQDNQTHPNCRSSIVRASFSASHPCKAAPSTSFCTFPWNCSGKTPK